MELFISKIIIFIFILSSLNIIKEIYSLCMAIKNDSEMHITNKGVFILGLSISYVLMTLITGFSL